MHPLRPKMLGSAAELRTRQAVLHEAPGVAKLNDWVDALASKYGRAVPWFDPADAGTGARVLFVLESPGPRASAESGSGIVSIDNDDQTAANLWRLRADVGLYEHAVHWNIVPFYLGTAEQHVVRPSKPDHTLGVALLHQLLNEHLSSVEVVVPMGKDAKLGWARYCEKYPNNHKVVVPTWHPSGQGLNSASKRQDAALALTRIARLLAEESTLRARVRDRAERVGQRVRAKATGRV